MRTARLYFGAVLGSQFIAAELVIILVPPYIGVSLLTRLQCSARRPAIRSGALTEVALRGSQSLRRYRVLTEPS
jgi:hypothetical protein